MTCTENRRPCVGVFCASSLGSDRAYETDAAALGSGIAVARWRLVYGGARCGLMGVLANAALAAGGEVIGVLPEILSGREIAHDGLTQLERVGTMHQRKARIHEMADALVALPGGYGTLDELLEAVTWAQIGLHAKPCILVNTRGYWDGLLAFFDSAVRAGFISPENRCLLRLARDAAEALQLLSEGFSRPGVISASTIRS
jgi:uncharacterized protein (TIGR00730 family)